MNDPVFEAFKSAVLAYTRPLGIKPSFGNPKKDKLIAYITDDLVFVGNRTTRIFDPRRRNMPRGSAIRGLNMEKLRF